MKVKLRAAYDDHTALSNETGLECLDESLAQQHQKDETDINLIVRKYTQTGELPVHNMPPLEQDFENVTTMQDAMDKIVEARVAFMQQPADVRARFHNDPAEFVEFCSNKDNMGEMRKFGLLSQEAANYMDDQEAEKARLAEQNRIDAEAFRKAKVDKS